MLFIFSIFLDIFFLSVTKQNKSFLIKAMLISLAVSLLLMLDYSLITGPHPQCGKDPDVGPCDTLGNIRFNLPIIVAPLVLSWTVLLGYKSIKSFYDKRSDI